MPAITTASERTGHWTKMRAFRSVQRIGDIAAYPILGGLHNH